MDLARWFDKNFGNQDGKLSIKDMLKDAPSVAFAVGDIVMLIAEFRVFQTGMQLTNENVYLSLGFVLVSSLPFYVGQILYNYNYANTFQMLISIAFIASGLFMSGYYGLRDFMLSAGLPVDAQSAFVLAVLATVGIIGGMILFAMIDDRIRQKRKLNRLRAEADVKKREMDIQSEMLGVFDKLANIEQELIEQYGKDVVDRFGIAKLGLKPTNVLASEAEQAELKNSKSQQ